MNLRMWIRLLYARRKFKGKCYYLSGSENLLAPLSTEEEEYWVKKYDEENSLEARNKLIEHNMRLVIYVAKKYETVYATLEDLVSIGLLGLFKAIKTFRYDKNIKLATYASRCIDNEILMFLRKNQKRKNEISFDVPLNSDSEGNELLLEDVIASNEDSITDKIEKDYEKEILYEAIEDLNDREKTIIYMRYGLNGYEEQTQKETAEILGISQSYISRLEKRILKKMRLKFQV